MNSWFYQWSTNLYHKSWARLSLQVHSNISPLPCIIQSKFQSNTHITWDPAYSSPWGTLLRPQFHWIKMLHNLFWRRVRLKYQLKHSVLSLTSTAAILLPYTYLRPTTHTQACTLTYSIINHIQLLAHRYNGYFRCKPDTC